MKPRAQRLGLLVALALVALALPATAGAAGPGWVEKPRSLHLSFEAKASNDYRISLQTAGHKQVTLRLERGNVSATYRTTGRVSRKGVQADFGELGEISVDFRGKPTRFEPFLDLEKFGLPPGILPQRECRGRRPQQEIGAFHGTIRFEGENGFARFERDSVKGKMQRTYRRLCKGGLLRGVLARKLDSASASAAGEPKRRDVYMSVLTASGKQGDREVAFATYGFSGLPKEVRRDDFGALFGPFAFAIASERRDGVLIQRAGLRLGDEDSLIASPPKRIPATATVAFPKPFEGTAEYRRAPGSTASWTGSLLARLPGAGTVSLTGVEMTTELCQVSLGEEENPCLSQMATVLLGDRASPALLRQGSGSHSQALADVRLSWSR